MNQFEAARLRYERRRGPIQQTGDTMKVEKIVVDRKKALELYRAYKTHQHYSEPIDREIQRAYQLIAQGRMVVKALESIAAAGLGLDKMPKLAIARADSSQCYWRTTAGQGRFVSDDLRTYARDRSFTVKFEGVTYQYPEGRAVVPLVPIHMRPKRGVANYHILWEADWKAIPKDPMLLRRIGGDLWLVVAVWDLTEVERAVMATRMSA